jgi:hypothetical protein
MTSEIGLAEVIEAARDLVEGRVAVAPWLRLGNRVEDLLTKIRQSRA